MKFQLQKLSGIFACNDQAVICREKRWLGKWPGDNSDYYPWVNPVGAVPMGQYSGGATTNSFLNTWTFIVAYDTLMHSGKVWKHDFLVKADPDAVILPDRIRSHVGAYKGIPCFFANCNNQGPKVYGAVEVTSVPAFGAYQDRVAECKGLGWQGWGEDGYLQNCMAHLGVRMIEDYALVSDQRCSPTSCYDGGRAAFHPFKDPGSWQGCFLAATSR